MTESTLLYFNIDSNWYVVFDLNPSGNRYLFPYTMDREDVLRARTNLDHELRMILNGSPRPIGVPNRTTEVDPRTGWPVDTNISVTPQIPTIPQISFQLPQFPQGVGIEDLLQRARPVEGLRPLSRFPQLRPLSRLPRLLRHDYYAGARTDPVSQEDAIDLWAVWNIDEWDGNGGRFHIVPVRRGEIVPRSFGEAQSLRPGDARVPYYYSPIVLLEIRVRRLGTLGDPIESYGLRRSDIHLTRGVNIQSVNDAPEPIRLPDGTTEIDPNTGQPVDTNISITSDRITELPRTDLPKQTNLMEILRNQQRDPNQQPTANISPTEIMSGPRGRAFNLVQDPFGLGQQNSQVQSNQEIDPSTLDELEQLGRTDGVDSNIYTMDDLRIIARGIGVDVDPIETTDVLVSEPLQRDIEIDETTDVLSNSTAVPIVDPFFSNFMNQ